MKPLLLAAAGLLLAGCGTYRPEFAETPLLSHLPEYCGGTDRVVVIPLQGAILLEEEAGWLSSSEEGPMTRVTRDLRRAVQDPHVKAVILRVNTPGGGVTASDLLRREVEAFRKSGRPVVVYAESLNASGGYYVSTAADWIVSHPSTVTGSIGVISLYFNVEGLLGKIGVAPTTIKSGPHKDMTGLFRKMTPEEEAIFQGIVDEMYRRFLGFVAQRPRLGMEKAKALADGRVYTAPQALENGLVDQVGYLEDAVAQAKRLAGLEGAVQLVSYERVHKGLVVEILNVEDRGPRPAASFSMDLGGRMLDARTPRFFYLWMP